MAHQFTKHTHTHTRTATIGYTLFVLTTLADSVAWSFDGEAYEIYYYTGILFKKRTNVVFFGKKKRAEYVNFIHYYNGKI